MRRAIDKNSARLKTVLMAPSMRSDFLGGVAREEGKVVKAFVGMNAENALKTKPKVNGIFKPPLLLTSGG